MFSTFPGGWPGWGLLLLRASLGITAIARSVLYLLHPGDPTLAAWAIAAVIAASGAALLAGLFTPLAALIIGSCAATVAGMFEARLTTLARENKRLKTELVASETTRNGDDRRSAGDALREQMNTLAAEVVSLTAKLEGPDSPIAKALAAPQEARSGTTSLADRVRALQRADLPS